MTSLSSVRSQAGVLAVNTNHPDVKKLARIVETLAIACQEIEKTANDAEDQARRAKSSSNKNR